MWEESRLRMQNTGTPEEGLRSPLPSPQLAAEEDAEASGAILRELLRDARKRRGISQMELALRIDFSPRHISFVEAGRSRPSRDLIEKWLDEVGAQPSLRSAALLHAGFAPKAHAAGGPDNGPASHPARALLERLLAVHEPFPAFLFDSDWCIRLTNRAACWMMSVVMPDYLETLPPGAHLDMIDSCAHPAGLLSHMVNAKAAGYALLAQLELEASANPRLRPRIDGLATSLARRFGPRPSTEAMPFAHATFSFATSAGRFDFFRFQSLVDLPQDVTLHSLRVELSLPLNEATKHAMHEASRGWD